MSLTKSYVTKEEIEQARQLDLLSYLQRYRPDELIKVTRGVYSLRSHDSLKISNGKWYRWSKGVGGVSALDYLVKVEGKQGNHQRRKVSFPCQKIYRLFRVDPCHDK